MFKFGCSPFRGVFLALTAGLLLAVPAWADEKEAVQLLQQQLFQLLQEIEADAGRYSIGLAAEAGENGLVVEQVRPNSAAAKAGLQKGDLITRVNREPVSKLAELAKAIAESKGEPLHLQITRSGKPVGITVKPEQRAGGLLQIVEEEEERAAQKPSTHHQTEGNPANRFQARPGQPMPGQPGSAQLGAAQAMMGWMAGPHSHPTPLPDDMEVTISKQGNKPAVIRVTQGVKSWKTDETELGMLPPPAQAYAARMLGRPQMPPGMMNPGMMMPGAGMGGHPSPANAPRVQQLPAGGLRFEIREEEEKKEPKAEAKPAPKKTAPQKGAGPKVKITPSGIEVEIREE